MLFAYRGATQYLWKGRFKETLEHWFLTDLPFEPSRYDWLWLSTTVLLIGGAFAILEMSSRSHFNQDDNFIQFLPVILAGCRRFFEHGELLYWSPFQQLGGPAASLGIYALTYPLTYLLFALSTYCLGHEVWTLDVFAALHILGGSVFLYLLCRRLGLRPILSVAATLSFQLSGYSLIVGRSWYYTLPVNLWLPAIGYGVQRMAEQLTLGETPSWKWAIATAFPPALLFHGGNAQLWVYTMGFFGVAMLFLAWSLKAKMRDYFTIAASLLLSIALTLPLLIPQWIEMANAPRAPWGNGIGIGWLNLLSQPHGLRLPSQMNGAPHSSNGWESIIMPERFSLSLPPSDARTAYRGTMEKRNHPPQSLARPRWHRLCISSGRYRSIVDDPEPPSSVQ